MWVEVVVSSELSGLSTILIFQLSPTGFRYRELCLLSFFLLALSTIFTRVWHYLSNQKFTLSVLLLIETNYTKDMSRTNLFLYYSCPATMKSFKEFVGQVVQGWKASQEAGSFYTECGRIQLVLI